MKKLLCIFTVIAMIFSVSICAFAAKESPTDWDEFYIVKQPENTSINRNDSFTLSIEVNAPKGAEVEYLWSKFSPGKNEEPVPGPASITIAPDSKLYPASNEFSQMYVCTVIGSVKNKSGNTTDSKLLTSNLITVSINAPANQKLPSLISQAVRAGAGAAMTVGTVTGGVGYILAPVVFIAFSFVSFLLSLKVFF